MDLKEIIQRPSPAYYSIEEACFVVEEYIFQMKNVRINVNIYKGLNQNSPDFHMRLMNQLGWLNDAFIKACERIKL